MHYLDMARTLVYPRILPIHDEHVRGVMGAQAHILVGGMIWGSKLTGKGTLVVPVFCSEERGRSPSLQAIIMGPMVPLSRSSAKYISFFSFILFAMYSVFTGFPAGPVCFVTNVCTTPGIHSSGSSVKRLAGVLVYTCMAQSALSVRRLARALGAGFALPSLLGHQACRGMAVNVHGQCC